MKTMSQNLNFTNEEFHQNEVTYTRGEPFKIASIWKYYAYICLSLLFGALFLLGLTNMDFSKFYIYDVILTGGFFILAIYLFVKNFTKIQSLIRKWDSVTFDQKGISFRIKKQKSIRVFEKSSIVNIGYKISRSGLAQQDILEFTISLRSGKDYNSGYTLGSLDSNNFQSFARNLRKWGVSNGIHITS